MILIAEKNDQIKNEWFPNQIHYRLELIRILNTKINSSLYTKEEGANKHRV